MYILQLHTVGLNHKVNLQTKQWDNINALIKWIGQTNKGCTDELTNRWMDRWLEEKLFGVKLQVRIHLENS